MKENIYFILYQLEIIDGMKVYPKKLSKIIQLSKEDLSEEDLSEDKIWDKLNIPDNYSSKILLNIQKL